MSVSLHLVLFCGCMCSLVLTAITNGTKITEGHQGIHVYLNLLATVLMLMEHVADGVVVSGWSCLYTVTAVVQFTDWGKQWYAVAGCFMSSHITESHLSDDWQQVMQHFIKAYVFICLLWCHKELTKITFVMSRGRYCVLLYSYTGSVKLHHMHVYHVHPCCNGD